MYIHICSYVPRAGQPATGSVMFTDIKVTFIAILHCFVWAIWERDFH